MYFRVAALAVSVSLMYGCSSQEKTVDVPPAEMDAHTQQARAAVKAFFGDLKGELVAAIKTGGPAHAVSVCNIRAGEIAKRVSLEQGMDIGRVSLRNRNPGNAASGWTKDALDRFEAEKAAGKDPKSLEYSTVVASADGNEFRYMKAIPTGEVCLNCHGADIAPGVQANTDALYPGDKATGYSSGDLRGACVVTKKL